jgi:hypothetical protein
MFPIEPIPDRCLHYTLMYAICNVAISLNTLYRVMVCSPGLRVRFIQDDRKLSTFVPTDGRHLVGRT